MAVVQSESGASPVNLATPRITREQFMDFAARWWVLALIASYAFRLWYCWWRDLVPDEAVYWSWTRHLDFSYFDHPPGVAYMIWLSTRIFGDTELGVRFGTATLAYASILILIFGARRVFGFDSRTTALLAIVWLTSPLLMGISLLSTPDTPAIFFSTCAMVVALSIVKNQPVQNCLTRWLLFGLFCGAAFLSKYTTVLVPGSVFLALLTSRRGREHLKRPGIYLAGVVALLVFSPVIYWNAKHDWASFRFQLSHGLSAESDRSHLLMLLEWIGGQALIWTPVLFAITVFVLARCWRLLGAQDLPARVLLWCATIPLIFFGYSGFKSGGEPNWPAFAYFPASILLCIYVAGNWHGERWKWTILGCILALGGMIITQFPEPFWAIKVPWVKKMDELVGWREFGQQLDQAAQGAPVIANRHQDAADASFYMPGQPDVWASSVGSRPTAFDYMHGGPDIRAMPRVLFLGKHVKEFSDAYGFSPGSRGRITLVLPSGRKRERAWTMMHRTENPTTEPSH